ncbi:hypothetical protein ABIB94_009246 [Bradyrhizobium sp. JR7.2]|uniref:DUF2971 domain-containing protein n=2 Tax=Nitrobacteraceae TaxID=41294 RepID=UPI0024AF4960|nr:DUF2971 domain-containing protein [Bradyrhizobium barranii]WFT91163.1 DUF2971 domain-containing protein [Bradyrhizobium barranii]
MSKRGQRRGKARARPQSGGPIVKSSGMPASALPPKSRRITDPDHSLFHYTTATGLIGIVESNTLWATHASFLNDTAECQLLSTLLAPQIRREFEKIVPELTSRGAFKPELLSQLGDNGMATEAERVVNSISRAIDSGSPIHITSFCLHKNGSPESEHGLLSQWRGYGRGGFAIEFDEAKIDDLTNIENERFSYQSMITRRVSYHDHKKVAGLDNFIGMANASLKAVFGAAAPNLARRPDVAEILGERELTSYIGAFVQAVPFLKSPRFEEENEYRIVALPTRSPKLTIEVDKRQWKPRNFREGLGGSMVPFIRLFEGAGRPLPIKKIIVGPHRDQQNQKLAAELLLEKHGVEVPVIASDTTLRF